MYFIPKYAEVYQSLAAELSLVVYCILTGTKKQI